MLFSIFWQSIYLQLQFILQLYSARWIFERTSTVDWEKIGYDLYYFQNSVVFSSDYPTDTSGYAPRDRENWQTFLGIVNALEPIVQSHLSQYDWIVIHTFAKRENDNTDRLTFRFDAMGFSSGNEYTPVGQVISLPFWMAEIGKVGQRQFWFYLPWQLIESGMDDELRNAIFEIRDGLRPWTYGALDVPVENDGNPGFLEIFRQLTNSEELGAYYQPTLRDLVYAAKCKFDLVFIKVKVRGERFESRDLILPLPPDDQWAYNHYGQLRVARFRNGVFDAVTGWKWIRSRDYTEFFLLPPLPEDSEEENFTYSVFAQWYGGLEVEALVTR